MEVLSERTKDSKSWINPDGTMTTQIYAGPIQVRQRGDWVPIDTTLVADGGRLVPKAADADVTVSADGTGAFAAISEVVDVKGKKLSRRFGIRWPSALGRPEVAGNTATWRDVIPGVADLVVQAQPQGFVHFVVFRQRPVGPVELRFPIELSGMSFERRKDRRLELTDATSGKSVAAAPPPHMWDALAETSPEAGSRAEVTSEIVSGANGPELVLRPDPAFLADPAVRYPVTVDPWMQLTLQTDTFVSTDYPGSQTGGTWLHAGKFGSGAKTARTFLQYNMGGMLRKHILNADLTLWNYKSNACGAAAGGIRVGRNGSAWTPSTLTLSNMPGIDLSTDVTTNLAYGFTGCGEGDILWSIEDIVQAWTDGGSNYGLQIRAADESVATNWRMFRSSENTVGAHPPQLTVQWNSYPTVPTNLSITPSAGGTNGGLYVTSLTPALTGLVGDGEWDTERIDFVIERDPAYPAEGSGTVWTGSVNNLMQGELGTIAVPAGALANGNHYRWRARGYDGTDYSRSWSAWQTFAVDTTDPAAPTVSLPAYAANVWSAKQTSPVPMTLDTTSADGSGYHWGLDDPSTPNLAADDNGGGDALTVNIDPKQGWHTLYVKSRDLARRSSTVTTYTFGVGVGEVIKPSNEERTQAAVTLASRAAPDRTGVRYEYKADVSSSGTWTPVPTADVTVPGSPTPIPAWPQSRADTSLPFADLYWDAAQTMQTVGRGDGPVSLRACFVSGTADNCSDPVTFTLEQSAFGSTYATGAVGPGQVALLTGDYSVTATDVNVFGLTVGRGHTTLFPPTETGAGGVFGPGWRASLPAGSSAVSGMKFGDFSAHGYVTFTGTDGAQLTYTVQPDGTFKGVSDASDESKVVKNSSTQFTHTDATGVTTVFTLVGTEWTVNLIDEPGTENTITYTHDAAGRVTRILAPVPAGVTCSGTLVAGCRALAVTYATTTTATGVANGWGDYAGLVKSISYTAYDPATSAMKTTTIATYAYDSTSHLRTATDPRSGLTNTYYYNGQGRLSQITPPGLVPVQLDYDSTGRIAHTTRTSPQGQLTEAIVYGVPISAPVNLTLSETEKWGQAVDLPRVGAAIFPAWRVPPRNANGAYQPAASDWEYAKLTYLDVNGRAVNTASYGAGAWQVGSTRYDEDGNVVWELGPGNRLQALTPTADTDSYVAGRTSTAERAHLLASRTTFSPDGLVLTEEAPVHRVMLRSGAIVSARQRAEHTYDEGKPAGSDDYNLLTTTRVLPAVVDGTATPAAADIRTMRTGYDPVEPGDPSGWDLLTATQQTTVMASGGDIVRRTRYDESWREFERRMPASNGADAGTTTTDYFTSGAHPSVAACGNKPQWAGLACRTGPKAQPPGKSLPISTTTYGYFGQITSVTETSGAATRTSTFGHDTAGRTTTRQTTATPAAEGGTAVPDATVTYDAATGLLTQVSAGGASITTGYDTLGRVISKTDADTGSAAITYDAYGRVATTNDGKGLYAYTYDGTDAAGKAERRGLVTGVNAGSPGTFTGAYSPDGRLLTRTFPGGLVSTSRFDNAGKEVVLTYAKSGSTWLAFTALPDADGRVRQNTGPSGSVQSYEYDGGGRLSAVKDIYASTCVTRLYGFNLNSNRTSLTTYLADDDGLCSTSTGATAVSHSYDAADRIVDAGYTYDAFGRTLTIPADQAGSGGTTTVGYFANDMIASLAQSGVTKTFTLDPVGRLRAATQTGGSGAGTVVNHYADDSDSPTWIAEADGSWTRNILDVGGLGAIQKSDGTVTLQLSNLHGDIVATASSSAGATGVTAYFEQTEYGRARPENSVNPQRYGWHGDAQRSGDALAGLVLMGARVYNPSTGRFLQLDPVPGGGANAYSYPTDPVNGSDLDGRCWGYEWGLYDFDYCYLTYADHPLHQLTTHHFWFWGKVTVEFSPFINKTGFVKFMRVLRVIAGRLAQVRSKPYKAITSIRNAIRTACGKAFSKAAACMIRLGMPAEIAKSFGDYVKTIEYWYHYSGALTFQVRCSTIRKYMGTRGPLYAKICI
ncbi:hypothetical protein Aph01nite_38170 [Acrocarpospora phusangensis]|uniref:Teneurin-like YD-shell domain-containing protein n=1 Tax=Acrocarpospora phusangensis TaxID=1070424 RepID=A0A919QAT4_9ACTN|nr:DNRLRE domain-containing protein [Acrocarpospora phusangensis]GIH25507.1 hypothetical protein Aph01nite_38170 [Acrocarpospora phusangensis]